MSAWRPRGYTTDMQLDRRCLFASMVTVLAGTGLAVADPKVTITPKAPKPGDPVLVTVTGATTAPKGKAGATPLEFFASKTGYQAVFAVPLATKPDAPPIAIDVAGAPPIKLELRDVTFKETDVNVADEFASPGARDRAKITADNQAIIGAALTSKGAPKFTRGFKRPPGAVTSAFGEWRRWNEDDSGFKTQHLGLDIGQRKDSQAKATNAGTVVLTREGFLTGNVVVIDHGAGISTAYYHLSKITVVEGDQVELGGAIGLVGETGRTTGPHLHVSVRVPGGFVDPAAFFALPIAPK